MRLERSVCHHGNGAEAACYSSVDAADCSFEQMPYSPSPPSTASTWPVMKCGPVAKNSTAWATSAAAPLRPMGVFAAKRATCEVHPSLRFAAQRTENGCVIHIDPVRQFGRAGKCDPAGSDAIHADFGREGLGHGFGEHVQGGLGSAVVGVAGPGMEAAERANVDDAAVRGAQMRQSLAGHEKRAAGIGLERLRPIARAQRLSSAAEAKTAALFTSRSRWPSSATTAATAARTEISERTSHSTATARRPRCGDLGCGFCGCGARRTVRNGDIGAGFGER